MYGIAFLAVETGIAPSVLMQEDEVVIGLMFDVLKKRAKAARRR